MIVFLFFLNLRLIFKLEFHGSKKNCDYKDFLLIVIKSSCSILTFFFAIQIIKSIPLKFLNAKWARKIILTHLLLKSLLLLRVLTTFRASIGCWIVYE